MGVLGLGMIPDSSNYLEDIVYSAWSGKVGIDSGKRLLYGMERIRGK